MAWIGTLAGTLATVAAGTNTPARGAAIDQVIIATVGAAVFSGIMLWLVVGHRSGRAAFVGRLAAFAERTSGVAGWSSLPREILGITLLVAVFGMYWDISLHVDNGRDPGPLANPAHYFILIGLFGVLFAGVAAAALPLKKPSRTSVRLPNGWEAPLGGVLIAICGSVSLIAFPIDDMWHRLFGQDVTLWGPTHLLLIGGAAFSLIGAWILDREGREGRHAPDEGRPAIVTKVDQAILAGALLVGLSTFQGEFDFAVPQFNLVFHPILLMIAAGIGLVFARLRLGRGGALAAVGVFLAIRGLIALIVGPILGETTPHFPLYIVEALVVEIVALRFPRGRPIAFGAVAGVGIGTLGLAAEWGWSHLWWTIPWPSSLFPEGAITGLLAAVAGGVIGGYIARALSDGELREHAPRWVVPLAVLVVVGLIAWGLPMPNGSNVPSATIALRDVHAGPKRTVAATVRLHPADAAKAERWLTITAWQGGGSVVDRLKKTGPGTYVTTKPIPVYGNWKSTLRLHRGRAVLGLPIYLPADKAIPVKGIPALPQFSRSFVRDKKLLQREQKSGVPGYLTLLAYLAVLAIWLGMVGALAWGLRRIERSERGPGSGAPQREQRERPVPAPARPASV